MAVRFNSTGDTLYRNSGTVMNGAEPYTVALWYFHAGHRGYGTCFYIKGGSYYHWFGTKGVASGIWTLAQNIGSYSEGSGAPDAATIGAWHWIECRYNGSDQISMRVNGKHVVAHTTGDLSGGNFEFGNNTLMPGADYSDGRICNAKAWEFMLPDVVAFAESCCKRPIENYSIFGWWPMEPGDRLRDFGPYGRHLTEGGTPVDEPPPFGGPTQLYRHSIAQVPLHERQFP